MSTLSRTSRILGAAFLLQFITSFSSGLFLQPAWLVPDDISATMLKIADDAGLMRANILLDMPHGPGHHLFGDHAFRVPKEREREDGARCPGILRPGSGAAGSQ